MQEQEGEKEKEKWYNYIELRKINNNQTEWHMLVIPTVRE